MEELAEKLKAYIGWHDIQVRDGVIYVLFSQNERMNLKNVKSSGRHFMNPTISFTNDLTQTFYLTNDGSSTFDDLMCEKIVFCVKGVMDHGIEVLYEHWTKGGILHREGAPAYRAWYENPATGDKDIIEMYYYAGVLRRDFGPAISIFKNVSALPHEKTGGTVLRFDNAVLECRHVPDEYDFLDGLPTNTLTQSWPFVHRLTLQKGQQLYLPGEAGIKHLRETAALRAIASWEYPDGLVAGYYPQSMQMQRFHEFWKGGTLESRVVGGPFRSFWVKLDSEDRRLMPPGTMRQKAITSMKFDKLFKAMIGRMGLTEKPFYEDADVEFTVLTDLPRLAEEEMKA